MCGRCPFTQYSRSDTQRLGNRPHKLLLVGCLEGQRVPNWRNSSAISHVLEESWGKFPQSFLAEISKRLEPAGWEFQLGAPEGDSDVAVVWSVHVSSIVSNTHSPRVDLCRKSQYSTLTFPNARANIHRIHCNTIRGHLDDADDLVRFGHMPADPLHMPLTDPALIDKGVVVILTVIYHRALLQDALNQI